MRSRKEPLRFSATRETRRRRRRVRLDAAADLSSLFALRSLRRLRKRCDLLSWNLGQNHVRVALTVSSSSSAFALRLKFNKGGGGVAQPRGLLLVVALLGGRRFLRRARRHLQRLGSSVQREKSLCLSRGFSEKCVCRSMQL